MAELVNLQAADEYLKKCQAELNKSSEVFEKATGGWSKEQALHLVKMHNSIVQLAGALLEVMHNNRDGRGGLGKR